MLPRGRFAVRKSQKSATPFARLALRGGRNLPREYAEDAAACEHGRGGTAFFDGSAGFAKAFPRCWRCVCGKCHKCKR